MYPPPWACNSTKDSFHWSDAVFGKDYTVDFNHCFSPHSAYYLFIYLRELYPAFLPQAGLQVAKNNVNT